MPAFEPLLLLLLLGNCTLFLFSPLDLRASIRKERDCVSICDNNEKRGVFDGKDMQLDCFFCFLCFFSLTLLLILPLQYSDFSLLVRRSGRNQGQKGGGSVVPCADVCLSLVQPDGRLTAAASAHSGPMDHGNGVRVLRIVRHKGS